MSPEDRARIHAWAQQAAQDPEARAWGRRVARALIGGSGVSAGKHEGGRT